LRREPQKLKGHRLVSGEGCVRRAFRRSLDALFGGHGVMRVLLRAQQEPASLIIPKDIGQVEAGLRPQLWLFVAASPFV
jgi:hypothetical protein